MKKRNWRIGSLIVMLLLALTGWKLNVDAAGTVTIFIDQKELNVNDTLRVTVQTSEPEDDAIPPEVTLIYDNSLLEFTYCSEEYGGGEGGLITLSSTTANLSFVAKKAGSASLEAEAVIDGDGNNKATASRSVSIRGSAASDSQTENVTENVTENETENADADDESETTGDEEKTEEAIEETESKVLSSNADLKKFKVYEAKLSPKFSADVTEYTVTLEGDAKQLLFTAKTKDSNAKVLAASGFSNLKNGSNRAVLNVEAEDGTRKVYKFTIIKEGKAASTEDTSQREVVEEVNGYIAIEDGDLCVNTTFPEEMVPEGFTKINYVYKEQIVEAAYSEMGEMILLYLSNADGSMGDFYIYYSGTEEFMDFIQLKGAEGHFIFPIQFPVGVVIPDGFQDSALQWNDKTVPAFMVAMNSEETVEGTSSEGTDESQESESQESETQTDEVEMTEDYVQPEDFYLVYAMNQDGSKGFYLYDSLEGTYQRHLDLSYVSLDSGTFDEESYVIFKGKSQKRMVVIGVLIVVIVIMCFLILNMFLKIRELEECVDDEDEEEDEKAEKKVLVKQADKPVDEKPKKKVEKKEKILKAKPIKEKNVEKQGKKQKVKPEKKSVVKTREVSKEVLESPETPVVTKEAEVIQKKQETRRPGPVMFDLTTPKVDGNLSPKSQREQLDDDFEFEFINIDE